MRDGILQGGGGVRTRAKQILLVERLGLGHRLSYVRVLAEYAKLQGYGVTLLVDESLSGSSEYGAHVARLDFVETLFVRNLNLSEVERISRRTCADLVLIPDGDHWLPVLLRRGWRGRGQIRVLVMRMAPVRHLKRSTAFAWRCLKRALMWAVNAYPRVNVLELRSALRPGRPGRYIRRVTDPIEFDADQAVVDDLRRQHGLDEDVYWFGVVGAITERKNVGTIMKALAGLTSVGASIGLFIAGKCDSVTLRAIAECERSLIDAGHRLVVVDRVLQDVELDASIAVCDTVVLAHSNEGPSGILGKALAAGCSVVAAGAKSLRRDLRRVEGSTWCELNVEALRLALGRAVEREFRERATNRTFSADFAAILLRD